ncbi:hypothetical protein BJX63DRAFT_741 [Aspergillus granulosus]|uniref:Uncharacterized protein n=1 Tax=Aspergillus granulosus TaxID=176169 RepID=A0ABR4I5A5_9EURO
MGVCARDWSHLCATGACCLSSHDTHTELPDQQWYICALVAIHRIMQGSVSLEIPNVGVGVALVVEEELDQVYFDIAANSTHKRGPILEILEIKLGSFADT